LDDSLSGFSSPTRRRTITSRSRSSSMSAPHASTAVSGHPFFFTPFVDVSNEYEKEMIAKIHQSSSLPPPLPSNFLLCLPLFSNVGTNMFHSSNSFAPFAHPVLCVTSGSISVTSLSSPYSTSSLRYKLVTETNTTLASSKYASKTSTKDLNSVFLMD
ncbi:hypothetical protein ADUPG1_004902, partial [Aduncisulcus paluster]